VVATILLHNGDVRTGKYIDRKPEKEHRKSEEVRLIYTNGIWEIGLK
jgi:hypothetical protein